MSFITDKQTLADLNLLGKYKTGSMFNLFNRAKTKGGEHLLEEMFRTPLTNAEDINRRSSCIRYLQELRLELVIDAEMADLASQYLLEGRMGNRLSSTFHSYRMKAQEVLYRGQQYYLHQKQINAVQEVLYSASHLLGQMIKKGKAENPLKGLQDELSAIVNTPDLKQLKAKYPYSIGQTAQYQYLFRGKCKGQLERLLHILYELDVYVAVADVAHDRGLRYATASLDTSGKGIGSELLLVAENLRHPSLSGAVGNSVRLTRQSSLMFLTGANMAGKSTWMKTLGVSFYLAHMGFPVAADGLIFKVMEGIYTSINVPDDISQGWSHFYAEVMRVKLVAEELSKGRRLFVLFDELFKGTNVKDAYDATLAVTQRLAQMRQCLFVISTHIIEVGEALHGTDSIQFRYMPTVTEGAVPRYTYQLTEGITSDRQGMVIIENERILEMLS